MTPLIVDLIKVNGMSDICYVEPYAGGAGSAINLLLGNHVDKIIINDANPCIYSFWCAVVEENERFVDRIKNIRITLDEWKNQKNVMQNKKASFDLGFATFFLSRTNRSGILNAGPIGGVSQEKQASAKYKIDCRFNKDDMISRITEIGKYKAKIRVENLDAIDFLEQICDIPNLLVYLDPPYFKQGKSLYMDYYRESDHQFLADYLDKSSFHWLLSYDNVSEIQHIYRKYDLYEFNLNYTAHSVRCGKELLTHSKNLILPQNTGIRRKANDILLTRINNFVL